MGYEVIAISPDQPSKTMETMDRVQSSLTLFSDSQLVAARAFGIAYEVPAVTREQLSRFGIDLEAASGESHHLLPVPSVFIVDGEGVIRFQYVNPDYKVRLDPEVLLAAARAARKTAEAGPRPSPAASPAPPSGR